MDICPPTPWHLNTYNLRAQLGGRLQHLAAPTDTMLTSQAATQRTMLAMTLSLLRSCSQSRHGGTRTAACPGYTKHLCPSPATRSLTTLARHWSCHRWSPPYASLGATQHALRSRRCRRHPRTYPLSSSASSAPSAVSPPLASSLLPSLSSSTCCPVADANIHTSLCAA